MAEIPVMPFEDASQLDDPEYLMKALESVCASELAVDATEFIYPQNYAEADAEEKANVAAIWGEDQLLALSQRVNVPRDEIVRRVLALQHNAFDTGLYKQLSMINHSCAPNCIKFAPNNSSGWASEIWTTQPVQRGAELTMSYRSPLETAVSAMRRFLQQHHRFHCLCTACRDREMGAQALAGTVFRADHSSAAARAGAGAEAEAEAEAALEAIEEAVEAMEREQKWLAVDEEEDVLHTCKRMQRACDELLERTLGVALAHPAVDPAICGEGGGRGGAAKAAGQLMKPISQEVRMYGDLSEALWAAGRNRSALLLLARVHKCYANAAALVLEPVTRPSNNGKKRRRVKRSLTSRSLLLFVVNAARLAELQTMYLGPEHPDLAGSHLDVAEGLRAAVDLYAKDGPADAAPAAVASVGAEGAAVSAEVAGAGGRLDCPADFTAALRAAEVALLGLPSSSSVATTADMLGAMREHRAVGDRLKSLYATRKRFPEAHAALTAQGAVYWGRPAMQR